MDARPFGRYQLLDSLGHDDGIQLVRAYDTATARTVALKLLPPHLVQDRRFAEPFEREAHSAMALNDPRALPMHGFGEIDGWWYLESPLDPWLAPNADRRALRYVALVVSVVLLVALLVLVGAQLRTASDRERNQLAVQTPSPYPTQRSQAPAPDTADGDEFQQAAGRFARDLTTTSPETIDADVQRVLDESTGIFHDDFEKRSKAFADVVRQSGSTSTGDVKATAVESMSGNAVTVLAALAVAIRNAASLNQEPRKWRMRITVQRQSGKILASNVEFFP
jgi:Mce-associated membrane protein